MIKILFIFFILLANFHVYNTRNITILIAGDFQEEYDEIELKNGTLVGGVARMKHVADQYTASFVYLGNALNTISTSNLRSRRERTFAVFDAFTISAYVLSLNEFSHSRENLYEFVHHFLEDIPLCNVRMPKGGHYTTLSSFGIISYVIESVQHLSAAQGLVVRNAVEFLEQTAAELYKGGHKYVIAAGCCGLNMAKKIAKLTTTIFAVFSGCSENLFWNNDLAPEYIKVDGEFPIVVKNRIGRNVIIAHVYGGTKFFGKLVIEVSKHHVKGHSGEMLYMYNEIPQNTAMLKILEGFNGVKIPSKAMSLEARRPIGRSIVFLNGECHRSECNLGNLIADAFVQYKSNMYTGQYWTDTSIGLVAAGMIKGSINATKSRGVVFFENIVEVIPIDDKLVTLTIRGNALRRALEIALDCIPKQGSVNYLQLSGLRIIYDPRRKPGRKLVSVKVRCQKCDYPSYSVLRRPDMYLVVTTENVAKGNFGHKFLRGMSASLRREKVTARQVVSRYIEDTKVLYISNSDRILQQAKISSTVILKVNLHIFYLIVVCIYIYNIM